MPKVKDITNLIESYAPLELMLDFDSAGLNSGNYTDEVSGIMLAENVTYGTIAECVEHNCNLLVTHHPAVFGEEIDAYTQSILALAEKYNINLYSCHTNLDCCQGGLNDYAAKLLDMRDVTVVDGCTRQGVVDDMPLGQLAQKVAMLFNDKNVKYVGDSDKLISKVAVCTGSGGRDDELVEYAKANGIQCIISGESKISIALKIRDYGLTLIDFGHFNSEIFCIDIFKSWLSPKYKDLIHISESDVDPYKNSM